RISLYHANEINSINDTEHIVIDLFQQVFGFRPQWNDMLINYELNSIDLYVFLAQIEECINAHIEINQVWSCNTLRDLYDRILSVL
ncbi:MAG: acyl carrier protein, partial [Clostridia bacterium]|nr:acyl carrier protein [Clostridia bacterium]